MTRKVFLENLPRGGSRYIPNYRINWKKSIGYTIDFIYDDIKGKFKIIDYDVKRTRVILEYENKVYDIFAGHLKEGKIATIIGKVNRDYIYKKGETIEVKTGKVQIIDKTKVKMGDELIRGYKYKCLNCQYENIISEGHLKEKLGCPVCCNQKVKIGYNDMWTTNPELAKLLNNPKDGDLYVEGSNIPLDWKCNKCGYKIESKRPSTVKRQGLGCPRCSDGISYPEKIMINVLEQLKLKYVHEMVFDWSQDKKYDFYIPSLNIIIETHGMQHYTYTGRGRSLKEERENDKLKEKLAKENGIESERYIVIDCRYSELDYIKNNIIGSNLKGLINLANVDWLKCHEFACNTLVKTACELWNSGIHSTVIIGEKLNKEKGTIRGYLKKGKELGWCDYSVEKVRLNHLNKLHKKNKKEVVCITTNEIFQSLKEASNKYNISDSKISSNCRGHQKTAGKHPLTGERLEWMYKEDYDKYIADQNKELIHT